MQLTQRALKEVAKGRADIPSWTQVDGRRRKYHPDETWDGWRREADQLARTMSRP